MIVNSEELRDFAKQFSLVGPIPIQIFNSAAPNVVKIQANTVDLKTGKPLEVLHSTTVNLPIHEIHLKQQIKDLFFDLWCHEFEELFRFNGKQIIFPHDLGVHSPKASGNPDAWKEFNKLYAKDTI